MFRALPKNYAGHLSLYDLLTPLPPFGGQFFYSNIHERIFNMKKIILLTGVACLFASQALAQTAVLPYLSAKARYSIMKNSDKWRLDEIDYGYYYGGNENIEDKVIGGSIAAGLTIPNLYGDFRSEIEYTYNAEAEDKAFKDIFYDPLSFKVSAQSLMFNMYYDFNTNTRLMPYLGGGIGASRIKASIESSSTSKTTFSWQIGGGLVYHFTNHVSLDFGYRYMNYGKFSDGESGYDYDGDFYRENHDLEVKSHELSLGLRYTF